MATDSKIELPIEAPGLEQVGSGFDQVNAKIDKTKSNANNLRSLFGASLQEVTGHITSASSALSSFANVLAAGLMGGGTAAAGFTAFSILIEKVGEDLVRDRRAAEEWNKSIAAAANDGLQKLSEYQTRATQIRREQETLNIRQRTGLSPEAAKAKQENEEAKRDLAAAEAQYKEILAKSAATRQLVDDLEKSLKGLNETRLAEQADAKSAWNLWGLVAPSDISKQAAALLAARAQLKDLGEQATTAEGKLQSLKSSQFVSEQSGKLTAREERLAKDQAAGQAALEASKEDARRRYADLEQAKKDHEAALDELESFNQQILGIEQDAAVSKAKLARERLVADRANILMQEGSQVYAEKLAAADTRIQSAEAQKQLAIVRETEAARKESHDKFLQQLAQSEDEAKNAEKQAEIIKRSAELVDKGVDPALARKQAEDEVTLSLLEQRRQLAALGAENEAESARAVAAIDRQIAALNQQISMEKTRSDAQKTQALLQQEVTKGLQFAAGIAANSMGEWLDATLNQSRAQEQLAAISSKSAAQQQAESDARLQTDLANTAKQAATAAVMATAAGLGFLAFQKYDSAALSFAEAALYGVVAGGTGIAAAAIGAGRGNTQAEDQQIAAARAQAAGGNFGGGGGGSALPGSGGGGGGLLPDRPLIINFTVGGAIIGTTADLQKAAEAAYRKALRLA